MLIRAYALQSVPSLDNNFGISGHELRGPILADGLVEIGISNPKNHVSRVSNQIKDGGQIGLNAAVDP